MKFFLAFEPRDFIHPGWTPKDDLSIGEKGPRRYLWEVYNPAPLDGVLVSRSKLAGKAHTEISKLGIKAFLRYGGTVFGDCGAFVYKKEPVPPFKPSEMLAYYDKCGFDFGATIDHLILSKEESVRQKRREITLKNAEAMFREWDQNYRNAWQLVGVAQGWDVKSYSESVKKLLEMGYEYIALGSLARRPTRTIIDLLTATNELIQGQSRKIKLHLFGVWRPPAFRTFLQLGVTSFDTATVLRQAWLRVSQGYHVGDSRYATIRVREHAPQAAGILSTIRDAAQQQTSIEDALKQICPDCSSEKKLEEVYRRTLTDRPWQGCPCPLCRKYGVEMMIFRGNERNMRRGFHNVWQMYESLQEQLNVMSKDSPR